MEPTVIAYDDKRSLEDELVHMYWSIREAETFLEKFKDLVALSASSGVGRVVLSPKDVPALRKLVLSMSESCEVVIYYLGKE